MKKKILIAEDFEPARKIMGDILHALGYDYETAENGFDVIFALKKSNFDAILLDLQMPLLDGFETIEHIRRNTGYPTNTIPVVAMTGKDYASELNQTYKDEGFDSVIEKPFSLDSLDELLKNVLENSTIKQKKKS
ncbi:MAG: response regulator [Bacteroidota bacterium]|nr:response regulator [Bacteroidota bacterium]